MNIRMKGISLLPKVLIGSPVLHHPTRDYTYVGDIVDGFVKVAESPDSIGETINLGSNFEISIGDIAQKVTSIIGVSKQVILNAKRIRPDKSEVERLWCDNTKAKQLLGWKPKISLREGVSRTFDWYLKHESEIASS